MERGAAESTEPGAVGAIWRTPPPELALQDDIVHVWQADLNLEAARLHHFERSLSAEELTRAERFRFARDRERFVAARGLLREIVAKYLDTAPRRLSFDRSSYGKPFLVGAEREVPRFSISHSANTVLIALARRREVGVDIEQFRSASFLEELIETAFSAPEREALDDLPKGEARRLACVRFWTRKEAYMKADGRGMSLPLQHLDVSAPTDQVTVLDEATHQWRTSTQYTVLELPVGVGHVASLAAGGQGWRIARWQHQA